MKYECIKKKVILIIAFIIILINFSYSITAQDIDESAVSECYSLTDNNKYSEAIDCFDKIIEADNKNIKALLGKGVVLYLLQKHSKAIEMFIAITELDSNNKEAWYYKGLIEYEAGRFQDSLLSLDKAININPEYTVAKTTKCSVLNELGREDELKKCLKEIKQ
ncbi:MAG: tetratricopeptide repeat protein [Cyanobacteriota bacterium]